MTSTSSLTELSVSSTEELRDRARQSLERCGVALDVTAAPRVAARSPITGEALFEVAGADAAGVAAAVARARAAFLQWRTVPAPLRGALVKRYGAVLAEHKSDLAELVSIEAGKIPSEALGEVQEMIDVCDFGVGLSRQLDGRTMPSERPGHRLMETWHPLGVVAVISAFNFPVAVWSWNTAVALVCGDSVVRPRRAARARDRLAGAVAYWMFDAAVLWAMLHAFGASPAIAAVALAYLIGQVANTVPLLGTVSGGMAGVLIAFGSPAVVAIPAVLAYRTVAVWLPLPPAIAAVPKLRATVAQWARVDAAARPGTASRRA